MSQNDLQFSSELEFVVLSKQRLEKLQQTSFFKKLEHSVGLKDKASFNFFINLIEILLGLEEDGQIYFSPLFPFLGITENKIEESRRFCTQDLTNKKEALVNLKELHNSSLEMVFTKYLHCEASIILPKLWFLIEPPSLKMPKEVFIHLTQTSSILSKIYKDRMELPVYHPYTLFEWVDVRNLPQNILSDIVREFQLAARNFEGAIPTYMVEAINYLVKGVDGEAEILVRYPI